MILKLDETVGIILDELERLGIDDRTITYRHITPTGWEGGNAQNLLAAIWIIVKPKNK
jgi:hypothetical protein